MERMTNAYIFVGRSQGKRTRGRKKLRLEDNIKTDIRKQV
jgi:hypothetical protein